MFLYIRLLSKSFPLALVSLILGKSEVDCFFKIQFEINKHHRLKNMENNLVANMPTISDPVLERRRTFVNQVVYWTNETKRSYYVKIQIIYFVACYSISRQE